MSRLLYFDCFSGVAGDMTLGALIDLGLDPETLVAALKTLQLGAWRLEHRRVRKSSLMGVKVDVWVGEATDAVLADHEPDDHHHHGHGHHYRDLRDMIARSALPPPVIQRAQSAFLALAQAEARVHGTTVEDVHFHEVGAVDSVVDLVGCAYGLWALGIESVESAPPPIGRGFVRSAHGRIPLPAPATAHLLEGVPIRDCPLEKELVTPTGAAMLKAWTRRVGDLPSMRIEGIGWGAGTLDLPDRPNLLRLFVGETEDAPSDCVQIEANIDDMTPEVAGYLLDRLFAAGALDAWFIPIQMKKNRPGVMVGALSRLDTQRAIEATLLAESTAIGLRRFRVTRAVQPRRVETVMTPFGAVELKIAGDDDATANVAPEYESCRRLAQTSGMPLKVIYQHAIAAWLTRSAR